MFLAQHRTEFGVDRSVMKKRFSDARAKGRMPDAKILFEDFSLHIPELQYTFHLVIRVQGAKELTMDIRATLMAFT